MTRADAAIVIGPATTASWQRTCSSMPGGTWLCSSSKVGRVVRSALMSRCRRGMSLIGSALFSLAAASPVLNALDLDRWGLSVD